MSHTVGARVPAQQEPSETAEHGQAQHGQAQHSQAQDRTPDIGTRSSGAEVGRVRDEGWGALRWPVVGLLAGAGWGVVARGWMRYVSDDPQFTWGGTLFIIGLAALAGVSLGLLELLRRRGARLWRLLVALPALVMFAGPGMPMLPSAVLGGLALTGRGGWRVRGPAVLLALAPVVALVAFQGLDAFPSSALLSVAGYVGLCVWLAAGWSVVWRRRVRG